MQSMKNNRNTSVIWLLIGLIMLLVAACRPDSNSGSSAPSKDATASASMYTLMASDAGGRTISDKVYVALDGDQARIYQRGSCANAVFCLGSFPIVKDGNRLEISISDQNRREARERLARTFDGIASKMNVKPSKASDPAPIEGLNSPLENIQQILKSDLADTMAVKKALDAIDKNTLKTTLDQIRDLKEAFIYERMRGDDPTANFIRTRAMIKRPVAGLMANENIRNVFYEKEILGSLLSDMDAVDREIAGYYACGAKIAREESVGSDQPDTIEKIAYQLEQLEQLRARAAQLERQYSHFMTSIGFEETCTAQNRGLVAAWNTTLWETMTASFGPGASGQYEIQSAVCQPLDRLAVHCCMAGDAARALRALKALDHLAGRAGGNTKISLQRTNTTWACSGQNITLQPVLDSNLADWRRWEQWANEINRRI